MNLHEFFAQMTPYLLGQVPYAQAVRALYGDSPSTPDARRLEIYGRFCRIHRQEAASVFGYCKSAVVAALGEQAWEDFIEDYFRAHPMLCWELNENGEKLPEFLSGHPLSQRLPFLPELADFEWWEWQMQVAVPGEELADDGGPLGLAPLCELRRYEHDFITWLDEQGARDDMTAAGQPVARESYVLFWRDRELASRRAPATPIELMALKIVSEGQTVAGLVAQGVPIPAEDLRETLADLHEAGILWGKLDG